MGMSANQGRLLLLVALRSDKELQAQKINDDREALSRAEEKLMTEYSKKTNNKKLTIKQASGDGKYVNLNAKELMNAGYVICIDGKKYHKAAKTYNYKKFEKDYKNYTTNNAGEDNNPLQWGILNGTITLQKKVDGEWKDVNYASESSIVEEYDDQDDAAAKAKYDSEMKKIQRKDKSLELQLDQIETQHKAYETEIESVQKVLNNNIENSFNTFNKN